MSGIFSVRSLKLFFIAVLILRFIFPFYYNPINNLFSDPARHWQNGFNLVSHPGLFNAIDPKLYQIYIYVLQKISDNGNNHAVVALFTGLLCSSFAYFWFRFCKEILPKKHAYIIAIIVGLFPSLIGAYAFFMNETLFLNILGLSLWLTFRAFRKKDLINSVFAFISLLLLLNARFTGLPIFAFFSILLFIKQKNKLWFSGFSSVLLICVSIFSGLYSYKVINIFSPFHFTKMSQIYYLADYRSFSFNIPYMGSWGFGSPSYYTKVMEPLYHYQSPRKIGFYNFTIDLRKGSEDWDNEIKKLEEQLTLDKIIDKKIENIVFLLFGPEWPASSDNPRDILYKRLSFHSRWAWAPLIILVLSLTPFIKAERKQLYILHVTFLMLVLLIIQSSGIIEGRYRTPIDPLILTSVYLILWNKINRNKSAIDTNSAVNQKDFQQSTLAANQMKSF